MAYMSVTFVLLLIKHFNATNAEVVKSMRKVLQVMVSFIVFPKPFDWKYIAGGAATVAALWWLGQGRKSQKQAAVGIIGDTGTQSDRVELGGGTMTAVITSPGEPRRFA